MNQLEFNQNLQKLLVQPLAPAPDVRAWAGELVRRDRWRTRTWAFLALVCWFVGGAGMLLMVVGLNQLVLGMRVADARARVAATQPGEKAPPVDEMAFEGTGLIHHSLPWVAGSVISLMLAALFTVLLIFSSRQATLNRINISLQQISEQLQYLRAGGGAGGGEAPNLG